MPVVQPILPCLAELWLLHLNEEEGSVMELQVSPNCSKEIGNDLFSIAPGDVINEE